MAKKKAAKKKAVKKKAAKKSTRASSQKRDTVRGRNATMYAKRDNEGQFKEMDEKGRSQRADRRTAAKRKVKSGFGDQGDQKRRGAKKAKKR
jgi:hypothetical protein